jgi:hypothetical protein
MMEEVVKRDLSLEEADFAATFFHQHWRPNHIFSLNRQLLLWQYYDNPYARQFSSGLTFKGAFNAKGLVGVFAYMPFALNRYGRSGYGCHLSAWWVDPEHRRGPLAMGLLHDLQHRMGFDACLAGINTPVAEGLYERLRWVVLRCIPRLVLPVEEASFLRLGDPAANAITAEMVSRSHSEPDWPNHSSELGVEVEELKEFERLHDLGWDEFYWKQIAPSQMGPARETEYLIWRYARIPIFRYQALTALCKGEACGLVVFRLERVKNREERVIRIVDLVARPGAAVPLIRAAVEVARREKAAMVDFFYTSPSYLDAFRACGFVDARDADGEAYWYPHLFQPLDHARNRLNCSWWVRDLDLHTPQARNDFFITKGDYEFDRPN